MAKSINLLLPYLMQVAGDQSLWMESAMALKTLAAHTYTRLGIVQFDTPRQPSLCQESNLRDNELIELG